MKNLTGIASLLLCIVLLCAPISAQADPVESLLDSMSLQQKVGQMFMLSFYGRPMNEPAREMLARWQPGAVVLFKSNLADPAATTRMTNSIQRAIVDAGGPPAFIAVDQEGGIIAHLEDGFTRWPVPMLLNATQDPDLAYRFGSALAQELRAVGINMNLAPVADLNTNPANPIIGRRSFGTNADQVGPIVSAVALGMQAQGVLATAKHFPGHGDTDSDSHVTLPILSLDRDRLDAVEMAPFRDAIDAGVGAMMVAHIWYSALDEVPNRPASLSPRVVTDLLRDELGFEGLIMPDAMDMDAIDTVYSIEESALLAVEAGHDIVVMGAHVSPQNYERAMQAVLAAVESGRISPERIDASVRRILQAKAAADLLQWAPLDPDTAADRVPLAQHAALIEEMFRAGVTVVYDKDERLPLSGSVGIVYPGSRPSLFSACAAVGQAQPLAVSESPTDEEIAWAQTLAQRVDSLVVFTLNAETNARQQVLMNALPAEKLILVALWSPYDLAYSSALPAAYVVTYSPLSASFSAVCDVLSGVAPALGQLVLDLGPLP